MFVVRAALLNALVGEPDALVEVVERVFGEAGTPAECIADIEFHTRWRVRWV
ncbi:MAG: hypothetical protein J07HN6_00249 [Halonotius sp. J07HN6]|nr:MAG: hypothetical protein J07HN6_00249 [Halonotius sp. J07HN6]